MFQTIYIHFFSNSGRDELFVGLTQTHWRLVSSALALNSNEDLLIPENPGRQNPETSVKESPDQKSNVCVFWQNFFEHGVEEPVEQGILVVWIGSVLLPVDESIGAAWVT